MHKEMIIDRNVLLLIFTVLQLLYLCFTILFLSRLTWRIIRWGISKLNYVKNKRLVSFPVRMSFWFNVGVIVNVVVICLFLFGPNLFLFFYLSHIDQYFSSYYEDLGWCDFVAFSIIPSLLLVSYFITYCCDKNKSSIDIVGDVILFDYRLLGVQALKQKMHCDEIACVKKEKNSYVINLKSDKKIILSLNALVAFKGYNVLVDKLMLSESSR